MPYEISVDNARHGLITTYSGELSNEEFLSCTQEKFNQGEEFLSKEYIESFKYSLSDLSAVSRIDIDMDTIKSNAALSEKALSMSTEGIMVVVAPTDLEFGLSRLWQTYAEAGSDRIKLFRTRAEADTWLSANFGDDQGLSLSLDSIENFPPIS